MANNRSMAGTSHFMERIGQLTKLLGMAEIERNLSGHRGGKEARLRRSNWVIKWERERSELMRMSERRYRATRPAVERQEVSSV